MQPKRWIHWHAVVIGYLADFLISQVIVMIALAFDQTFIDRSLFESSIGIVTGLLLMLATVFGGWLAGRLAKEERFLHGFMVGGFGILLNLIEVFFGATPRLDSILLQFTATLLAGFAGYMSRWTLARQRK